MVGFNIDQHLTARHSRVRNWTIALGVSVIAFIANMFLVLAYGSSASIPGKVALAVLIISVVVYAVLETNSAINEFAAIRKDKIDGLEKTNYWKNYIEIPLSLFKQLSILLYVAIGATQLWALFAG